MPNVLLLVDYENVQRIDMSILDESHRAIIFVGASQNPPKAASKQSTAHRFRRVDFQKIAGAGKNALDFHIAFQLGRTFESKPDAVCIVISRDKGYDPLLLHLTSNGFRCRRVESFADLVDSSKHGSDECGNSAEPTEVVCRRCGQSKTIDMYGGRWCTNCGTYATPPDPGQLPSNRPGYREPIRTSLTAAPRAQLVCVWCHQATDVSDGIYDDGDWMCGGCIAQYAR